jgi:zinc transporter 5/7
MTDIPDSHEILTGAVIVLPWIVLSWYNRKSSQAPGSILTDNATAAIPIVSAGQVGQKTCILTAMTLVLFGCGQLLRTNLQKSGSSGASSIKLPAVNTKTVQVSLSQVISVALPIFATLKIGGFLVAFALLLAAASGVPTTINGNPRAQERYSKKKMSIALLAVATVSSLLGLNYAWDSSPFSGYVALLISIFIIAPPFPSLRQDGPIPEPGLVAPQGKSSGMGQSSVMVTTDAPLAVISGSSLALFTLVFTREIGFGISDVFYLLVPTGIFAVSLMACLPKGLRSSNKIGLAICTGAAALLCSPHIQDDLIVLYAARGILAAASFLASRMDDSHLHSDSHAHNHTSHGHNHSHTTVEASRISKWLLQKSEPYPLLHSILKEKDSRSIFYFMW